VIEINLKYAQETIGSEEFRNDPSILDKLQIPEGKALRRAISPNAIERVERTKEPVAAGLLNRQDSIKEDS